MEHIAIDLGSRESQICVRSASGQIIEDKRWATSKLRSYLEKRPPSRVVLETCAEADPPELCPADPPCTCLVSQECGGTGGTCSSLVARSCSATGASDGPATAGGVDDDTPFPLRNVYVHCPFQIGSTPSNEIAPLPTK